MRLSNKGIEFLIQEEGVKLSSYLDSAGVWTIGTGFTYYPNGSKVKKGDTITEKENKEMLKNILLAFEINLNSKLKVKISQNKFDALLSLSYNIGTAGFNNSTVLREVNKNPDNEKISDYFKMWRFVTVNGTKKPILLKRREREVYLYFNGYD